MTKRTEEDPRDKHSRQPQEARFNINVDGVPGGVDYTPLCLSRTFGNLYTVARAPPCDAYTGPYIKCVRTNGKRGPGPFTPTEAREMDGTRGTRGKKRADNGAFLNFGISGGFLVTEWTGL